ncbi:hypothetical protein FSP39_009562, partial [Pinctada imbricata]
DSNEARYVFHLADKNQDYLLDKAEFHQVFYDFDRNNDGDVTSDEFVIDWQERNLGSAVDAVVLFTHLDVDRNGVIHDADLPWIEKFFDRDLDTEGALTQWFTETGSREILLSGPVLTEKATDLVEQLNEPNFSTTNVRLEGQKSRDNIEFKRIYEIRTPMTEQALR